MNARSTAFFLFTAAMLAGSAAAADEPSGPGKKTALELGRSHQALLELELAADDYEAFARADPRSVDAPGALKDAIGFRLGLGQVEAARKDADWFLKTYGAKLPFETTKVELAISAYLLEHGDLRGAKKQLETSMSRIDRSGPLDAQVEAHTWLGRVSAGLGDARKAKVEYEKVRALWKDPSAAVGAVHAGGGGGRRLGAALNAVGEALFYLAEQKRVESEKIAFPAYRGPGSRESVLKHVNTRVADWVRKKRAALESVEKEYTRVVSLQPEPPPKWVIAASRQVGEIRGTFVSDFRSTPVPTAWKSDRPVPGIADLTYKELRTIYYAAIDESIEPQRQRAKAAFKTCLLYSVRYQRTDPNAESCDRWLSKRYPTEFPVISELHPRWGLLGPLAPRPEPLAEPKTQ